jgi:hypothetical protein
MKPQDIAIDLYRQIRTYHWLPLDPKKADYGASWGLRGPQGTTYLLITDLSYPDWTHRLVAIGQYSGLYNIETGRGADEIARDIESILKARAGNLGIDRKIKKAEFDSWVLV